MDIKKIRINLENNQTTQKKVAELLQSGKVDNFIFAGSVVSKDGHVGTVSMVGSKKDAINFFLGLAEEAKIPNDLMLAALFNKANREEAQRE